MKYLILVSFLLIGSLNVIGAPQKEFDNTQFSENSEYNYKRIIEAAQAVQENRDALNALVASVTNISENLQRTSYELKEVRTYLESIRENPNDDELRKSVLYIAKYIEETKDMDIQSSLAAVGARLDSTQEKVNAMADKLDAEDVTNIDTDYRATIEAL